MTYRYDGIVKKLNTYGDRVERTYTVSILADNMNQAVEKARAAFSAEQDRFRGHWSHTLSVESVTEVPAAPEDA